jgi:hypothetical protein
MHFTAPRNEHSKIEFGNKNSGKVPRIETLLPSKFDPATGVRMFTDIWLI